MKTLSVLLVEDSVLFRSALENLFAKRLLIELTVCSSADAVTARSFVAYDVVLIDSVTWAAGPEKLPQFVENVSANIPVLLLGGEEVLATHVEALRKGATGLVKQTAPLRTLVQAIRSVQNGEVWLERDLFRKVILRAAQKPGRPPQIAAREGQILYFVAKGKTNKEIGAVLGFSERNVKAYVSTLFRKTGVSNRSALAVYAITHGLIAPLE